MMMQHRFENKKCGGAEDHQAHAGPGKNPSLHRRSRPPAVGRYLAQWLAAFRTNELVLRANVRVLVGQTATGVVDAFAYALSHASI